MKKLKFDEALDQLEQLTEQMESGELKLEEAVKVYEKGIALALECQRILQESEGKIRLLSEQADGILKTEPLVLEETAE